jgi:hypothetical protein
MRRLAPFVIAFAAIAMWPTPTAAYDPHPRMADLVITHDGNPYVVWAIGQWSKATGGMVQDGGVYAGTGEPEIQGSVVADGRGDSWMGFSGGKISRCVIEVGDADDKAAWMHEVGHCLMGPSHFHVPGALMQTGANASGMPNWYDLFQFYLRYGLSGAGQGPGHSLFIPMVAGG